MRTVIQAIVVSFLAATAAAEPMESDWVLLPGTLAAELTKQCSRSSPADFEATWEPSSKDIEELEARLAAVEKLKAKECCFVGGRVDDVQAYYRQYVGIVLKGRKLIYINALRRGSESDRWRTEPVVYCDGGSYYWGAVFDPKSGKFSQLAINGNA